jgi:hypothetical protein
VVGVSEGPTDTPTARPARNVTTATPASATPAPVRAVEVLAPFTDRHLRSMALIRALCVTSQHGMMVTVGTSTTDVMAAPDENAARTPADRGRIDA